MIFSNIHSPNPLSMFNLGGCKIYSLKLIARHIALGISFLQDELPALAKQATEIEYKPGGGGGCE